MQKLLRFILFSNLFYCLCVIALIRESAVVLSLPQLPFLFYLFVSSALVLFYNHTYYVHATVQGNIRSQWFFQHQPNIKLVQIILSIFILSCSFYWAVLYYHQWLRLPLICYLLLFVGLLFLFFYYNGFWNLRTSWRKYALLKPIMIGYTWTVAVSLLPVIFAQVYAGQVVVLSNKFYAHFVSNVLFIATLAIMFDIKDYEDDYNKAFKSIVVKFGVSNTIYKLIIPLFIAMFLFHAIYFTSGQFLLHCSLYSLCIAIAVSLLRKQSIVFYLFIVDGLMVMKALSSLLFQL